jgi:predicted transcriptional regulator
MSNCSVHIYRWGQSGRRKLLRRLVKEGFLRLDYRTKTHFHYTILNMEEYKKRVKS